MSDQNEATSAPSPAPAKPKPTTPPAAANKEKPARTKPLKTKADTVIALLSREGGATIAQMMKATGWQSHSVRGFLAGTLKKKLGRGVASEKGDKDRVYRLLPEGE